MNTELLLEMHLIDSLGSLETIISCSVDSAGWQNEPSITRWTQVWVTISRFLLNIHIFSSHIFHFPHWSLVNYHILIRGINRDVSCRLRDKAVTYPVWRWIKRTGGRGVENHATPRLCQTLLLRAHSASLCFWGEICSFRICSTFAYELKRSLQSLLFDVWVINNIYALLQDMLF